MPSENGHIYHGLLESIRDINLFKKHGNLELRVYDESPTSAMLVVDDEFLLYNIYPKVKVPRDPAKAKLGRGTEGEIYTIGSGDWRFGQKVAEFEDLWVRSRSVDLSLES